MSLLSSFLFSKKVKIDKTEELLNLIGNFIKPKKVNFENLEYDARFFEDNKEKRLILVRRSFSNKEIRSIVVCRNPVYSTIEFVYFKSEFDIKNYSLDRKNGPAFIKFDKFKNIIEEKWFRDGVELNEIQTEVAKKLYEEVN